MAKRLKIASHNGIRADVREVDSALKTTTGLVRTASAARMRLESCPRPVSTPLTRDNRPRGGALDAPLATMTATALPL